MSEVFFYRLSDSEPHGHIRRLLERSLSTGWRVAVRARSDDAIDELDRRLWRVPGDSFLPHGKAGGQFDAEQPVLLTTEPADANRPDALILFDGAEIERDDTDAHRRVSVVFRAGDDDEMRIARQQWARLAESGVCVQYWAHSDGRWKMEARRNYQQS